MFTPRAVSWKVAPRHSTDLRRGSLFGNKTVASVSKRVFLSESGRLLKPLRLWARRLSSASTPTALLHER
jgi:hypothetical protein